MSNNPLTVHTPELQSWPPSSCLNRYWLCWEHGLVPGQRGCSSVGSSSFSLPSLWPVTSFNEESVRDPVYTLVDLLPLGLISVSSVQCWQLDCPLCCGHVPACLILQTRSFWRLDAAQNMQWVTSAVGRCLLASPHLWFSDTALFRENFMSELSWTGFVEEKAWLYLMLSPRLWCFLLCSLITKITVWNCLVGTV